MSRRTVCTDCGVAGDPRTRFCARCGRVVALTTGRDVEPTNGHGVAAATRRADPVRSARRRGVMVAVGLTALVMAALAPVVLPDRDAPGAVDLTDPTMDDTAGPVPVPDRGRSDAVDVERGPNGSVIETVGGFACQGPDGPTGCVTHVAELDLAASDEVQVIRGRIVVASEDGIVSAHSLRDGNRRWRASFDGPVTLHPDVAESIPVSSPGALDVLDLDSGSRIGHIGTDARQVATVGPWIVVDDGDRIAAYGVTGRPGWTRELDGGTAVLSPSGSYVRRSGSLIALYGNTGEQRFDTPFTGDVGAVIQQDGRVLLVTDEPPQVQSVAADGTRRSSTPLPGTRLAWADFTPDGARLVALTQDDGDDLRWLTIVDRFQPRPPRTIPLAGTRTGLDPVLDDRILLVPYRGAVADLLVIDLDSRSVINRVTTDRPLTDVGLAGDTGFATIDDLGMLRVQGLRAPEPAYTVALGAEGRLLQARPLLVRTQRAIVAFQDVPAA